MRRLLRLGLPALAAYALVLQVFLAGAAPAVAFDVDGTPICAELVAGAGHPAPVHPPLHHQGPCLAHCAAPLPIGLAAIGGTLRTPEARGALLAPVADAQEPTPLWRPRPGARAPPEA